MNIALLTDEQLDAALSRRLAPVLDEVRFLRAEVQHLTQRRGDGMNSQEAADLLGVSTATVKRWADPAIGRIDRNGVRHVLPSTKLPGGQYRFNRSDVEAFDEKFLLVLPGGVPQK